MLSITNRIYLIHDQKVMLDRDLAELYGISVKALNQAMKRNKERFPKDFCFQLDSRGLEDLRSQIVTTKTLTPQNYMRRSFPYVFTEAGAFALSFVIRSKKAIEMGQFIVRAFTHLRRFILKNENLMMELRNNDQLSMIFKNFEKRIEQDLIVLYQDASKYRKKLDRLEKEIKLLRDKIELK